MANPTRPSSTIMALLLGKLFETPNDPLLVLARIAAGIVFFAYMELRKYLAGPGGSGFTVTMQSFTQM